MDDFDMREIYKKCGLNSPQHKNRFKRYVPGGGCKLGQLYPYIAHSKSGKSYFATDNK